MLTKGSTCDLRQNSRTAGGKYGNPQRGVSQRNCVAAAQLQVSEQTLYTLSKRYRKMFNTFWKDEEGVILSAEIVLLGTILVLGMIVGLVEVQSAVVAEMGDLGDAIGNMDQSYQVPGIVSFNHGNNCGGIGASGIGASGIGVSGIKAATHGASYSDRPDLCDCNSIIVCASGHSRGEQGTLRNRGAAGGVPAHHGGAVHRAPVRTEKNEHHKRQPVPAIPQKK